jgi:hypothetical protein
MTWLYDQWSHAPTADREERLNTYHAMRVRSASAAKADDAIRRARLQQPAYAWEISALAISKSGGEAAMFGKISFGMNSITRSVKSIAERVMPGDDFSEIDENALALIREKRAPLHESPESFARVIESFRRTLTADTLQNEYVLRPQVHQLFRESSRLPFAYLNARVYAEVFRTPAEDPWLGLRSDQTFTALASEGVEQRRDTLRGR